MKNKAQPRTSSRRTRSLVTVLLVVTLGSTPRIVSAEALTKPLLKTERFDREPAWDAHNHRPELPPIPVVQDFGFSPTQHAGGAAPGEIGGRVQRSTTSAFYAMRLPEPKTLEHPLRATGTFAATQTDGMAAIYFGWINTRTPASRPLNWLGFCLTGSKHGSEITTGLRTAGGLADGLGRIAGYGPGYYEKPRRRDFNMLPVKTRYTFDMAYDPAGAGGAGEFVFTLGGDGPFTGGPFKYKLPPDLRKSGATFDAFGIINGQAAGGPMTT